MFSSLLLSPMIGKDKQFHTGRDTTFNMIRVLSRLKSGLKICHLNAQSLPSKIDEFRYIFESSDVDVVCVSETWFSTWHNDDSFCVNGYKTFRLDRAKRGGGVAVFVKNSLSCFLKCISENTNLIEYIFLEIKTKYDKILIGCVYRPNKYIAYASFVDFIENLSLNYNNIVVAGDFNSDLLCENEFVLAMRSLGLFPANSSMPTHFTLTSSSLLDIFFVNDTAKILLFDQLSVPGFSKHDLIFMTFDFQLTHDTKYYSYRDFLCIDYKLLEGAVEEIDWECIHNLISSNEQISFIEENISSLFDRFVPLVHKPVNDKNRPWFNNHIKHLIYKRNKAYRKWKSFRTSETYNTFKACRRDVNKSIRLSKLKYYEQQFSTAVGSKQTWNKIRAIGIGNKNQPMLDLCDVNVNVLNENFVCLPGSVNNICYDNYNSNLNVVMSSFCFECVDDCEVVQSILSVKSNAAGLDGIRPKFIKCLLPKILKYLTYALNTVLTTSIFPNSWKRAKIIPIKKANGDYRPIAILPFLSKVLERIMHRQINTFLNNNALVNTLQLGFRCSRSCITALLKVSDDIRLNIDKKHVTFLTLLDHSKAFDSVDHKLLILKLKNLFSFSTSALTLIETYLSDRLQAVCGDNTMSNFLPVTRGVPQGSILGPLLFVLYINDLFGVIKYSDVHVYADDVQLYVSCPISCIDTCISNMNSDLSLTSKWASDNGLILNPDKSQCIVIYKKYIKLDGFTQVKLNDAAIKYVDNVKNLGVTFNRTLTWRNHIFTVIGKVYGMLRNLWTTQYFTPVNIRLLLAKTYLLPTLLYGCELYTPCDSVCRSKLNVLYNNTARYVYCKKRYDHISVFAKKIASVSFCDLLRFKCLVLLHKIINTQKPRYLKDRLMLSKSCRSLNLVPMKHSCLVTERQYFVFSVRLWNTLPYEIKRIKESSCFKNKLLRYLAENC